MSSFRPMRPELGDDYLSKTISGRPNTKIYQSDFVSTTVSNLSISVLVSTWYVMLCAGVQLNKNGNWANGALVV